MPSLLSETIANITNNHSLAPITDYCKVEDDNCRLKSGHEVTFISFIADHIFQNLNNSIAENLFYNQWVYMPSRRAEKNIGYDLSVGKYDEQKRIRTMNKLLLGWCDTKRKWECKPTGKDHNHFIKLYNDWSKSEDSKDNLISYLVINICHCIHEFRRMGLEPEGCGFVIPGIESLLRTIVIPLTPIFEILSNENIEPDNVVLKYCRNTNSRLPNEDGKNYLDRISRYRNHEFVMSWNNQNDAIKMEIVSFQVFIESSVRFLIE